jgi:serine protease Do
MAARSRRLPTTPRGELQIGVTLMRRSNRLLLILWLFAVCVASAQAQQLRDTFRRVKPSVVVVHVMNAGEGGPDGAGAAGDEGLGSGVLISPDGKVITAAHVVDGAELVTVELDDEKRVTARVVCVSLMDDLALLQLDSVPPKAVAARLGDSDRVEAGDEVFIVGAPYGLSDTLTTGRVSARRRTKSESGIVSPTEFLQTDAAINPGNSGGPVFNMAGEVVGIVSSVVTGEGGLGGVGFAATSKAVHELLTRRGSFWADVKGVLLRGEVANVFNLPQPSGFLVTRVARDSAAERLGLKGGRIEAYIDDQEVLLGGDIILELNGAQVNGDPRQYEAVFAATAGARPGSRLTCKVLRGGKVMELSTRPALATGAATGHNE